jgi:photosystem II stability/assembly factor-like uncharacterized protein
MITRWTILVVGILAFAILGVTCAPVDQTDKSTTDESQTPKTTITMRNIGPVGGRITAIAFHPTTPDEVWASGGDASGLYRSRDGGHTWTVLQTPPDQSSCCLMFNPSDANRAYAPNCSGRGLLRTTDGGESWSLYFKGMPKETGSCQVYDLAVDPVRPERLYLATAAGLFRSTDDGLSFQRLDDQVFRGEYDFRSVTFHPDGRLFAGGGKGGVFATDKDGRNWTAVIQTGYGVPVTDLVAGETGLYIAYATGELYYNGQFAYGSTMRLAKDAFASGGLMRLVVKPGRTTQYDRVYVGTTSVEGADNWGLFRSNDGGITFSAINQGIEGRSILCIAIDPFASQHLLVGTDDGLFESTDGGASWSQSDNGLRAGKASGLAEDAKNAKHLLIASSPDGAGEPDLFETFDGGTNWSTLTSLQAGACTVNVDPRDADIILAGTTAEGIYRSVNGSAGPWEHVLPTSVHVAEIQRHFAKPDVLYANATDYSKPATEADLGLYCSSDNGAIWVALGVQAAAFAPHPTAAGECVFVNTDAYATTDNFSTTAVSLGLAAVASDDSFTAVAFNPDKPTMMLVAGSSGDLFITENYAPRAGKTTWRRLTTPIVNLGITQLAIVPQADDVPHLYFAAQPDTTIRATGSGVYRSTDGGETWENITADARPCSIATGLITSASVDGRLYAPLLGGGVYELTATTTP